MVVCPSFKTIQNPLLSRFSQVFWMEKRPASGGIWRSRALSFQGKFHSMVQEPHVDWRVPYGFVWKQGTPFQPRVDDHFPTFSVSLLKNSHKNGEGGYTSHFLRHHAPHPN